MALEVSTPLTVTGLIATILSVVFATASYLNSKKRQRAKQQARAAAETSSPAPHPQATHIVIPPQPEPAPPEPMPYAAPPAASVPAPIPAPTPATLPVSVPRSIGAPPPASVFKQFITRPGSATQIARKATPSSPADAASDEREYVWE